MPWCHTCRVEYPGGLDMCPECAGKLTPVPAPERRLGGRAWVDGDLVVVGAFPAAEAFLVSDRLDGSGIPSALREASRGGGGDHVRGADGGLGADGLGADGLGADGLVHVLVPAARRAEARRLLFRGRRHRRNVNIFLWIFLATAISVFLSAALFLARWMMSGSPLPR